MFLFRNPTLIMHKPKQNLLTITIILFALPLWAAEFTADSQVVIAGQPKQSVFYVASGKWRMNENAPEGKRAAIFREDDKTITILWPDRKLGTLGMGTLGTLWPRLKTT